MKPSRHLTPLIALAFAALSMNALAEIPSSLSPQEQAIVTANNAFACDLYAQLQSEKGNLFFSPFSVSTALMMTYAGAKGDTAAQMHKTLRLPASSDDPHAGFAALLKHFDEVSRSGNVQLDLANSLWPQKGEPILESFLKQTKERYGVEVTPVDYAHAEPKARAQINQWVENKTQDKIKNIIASPLAPNTSLVLVNALYFKGAWANDFNPYLTQEAPFFSGDHPAVQVPLMQQTKWLNYAESSDHQMLELPYKKNALSMFVLLPKDKTAAGLTALEKKLTVEQIADWKASMKGGKVEVYLPKFKMEWGTAMLNQALENLGMSDAFEFGKADFSGINGNKLFFIGAVLHKAFVAVDEKGTEAAAATGEAMLAGARPDAAPPPVFRADHPFVFFIQDNATGSLLFMGRVTNPGKMN